MTRQRSVRPADVAGIAVAVLTLATAAGRVVNRNLPVAEALPEVSSLSWLTDSLSAALFGVAGWYIATRRPGVVFGWLALAAALGHGLSGVGLEWLVASELGGRDLPGVPVAYWLTAWGSLVEVPVLVGVFALFPEGVLPRGGMRPLASAAVAVSSVGVVVAALDPAPTELAHPALSEVTNPVGLEALGSVAEALPVFFAPAMLCSVGVLLTRWRAAHADQRRLLGWMLAVAVPAAVLVPAAILALPDGLGVTLAQASTVMVLSVLVAAALRDHVYGIEVVLSRVLVWTVLTSAVVAVYTAAVGIGMALGGAGPSAASVIGVAAAAIVLTPLRFRVERAVTRLLYGQRDEPYVVVSEVAARVSATRSADELLPAFVSAAASALRVPYVAIELDDGVREAVGDPVEPLDRLELVQHGARLGTLVVGHRYGERRRPSHEQQLLAALAHQAAVIAAQVRLTRDLLRSRERIVMAREEERRRLRRDLHDGLGPQLTGIALGLDELASTSDGRAGVVIRSLRGEITEAIADIRRLVQGLRPPQLDTVGLPDALRSDAERLGRAGVFVDIDIPDELPQLPAAVEVAALRICGEALTNVARHADATRCSVRLVVDGDLHLEIVDDGRGLSARDGAGVGLSSMRERAEEVGGTCQVEAVPTGGCRVRARIPVDAP